jgi:hypothetical protein
MVRWETTILLPIKTMSICSTTVSAIDSIQALMGSYIENQNDTAGMRMYDLATL